MKIRIKKNRRKIFTFYVPLGLVKFLLRDSFVRFAMRHSDEKERAYIKNIDFKALREAFNTLIEYKGLKLVNVESEDGDGVEIVV
ncbi:hypothetical protein SH2C18_10010 [Clostridium sediminicola]|uniref:hypothetical protein n=1 Tax=Clostridium sediminicola TaxID=3114879 RepID=UPI0031F1FC3F